MFLNIIFWNILGLEGPDGTHTHAHTHTHTHTHTAAVHQTLHSASETGQEASTTQHRIKQNSHFLPLQSQTLQAIAMSKTQFSPGIHGHCDGISPSESGPLPSCSVGEQIYLFRAHDR